MKIIIAIICAAAFLLCPYAVHAEPAQNIGAQAAEDLQQAVPPEAAELLEDSGITPENNGAAGLSLGGVVNYLLGLLTERAAKPLRLLVSLAGIVLLSAIARSAADTATGSMNGVFATVGVLAGAGMTTAAVADCLNEVMQLLYAASAFMLVFIPTFAGILAVMGRAAAASAVNTVTLAAAQLFSQLAVNFLVPLCGSVMGLSITGAVHPELKITSLGEFIKKVVMWVLTALMTIFISILSLQTFVTNSADSVLIRTAKFAVSSAVPIVGGTISDAVSTVGGSLALLHSGVGTYGMIAAAVMIMPMLITVICYKAALCCAEAVSDIFGIKELSALFKSCGAVMSIIIAVIACFLLMNTVSAAIMLAIGNGTA
ncbi:MAG: hypothetical protein ACI4KM_11730 [Oscillospiraceae bacterium]